MRECSDGTVRHTLGALCYLAALGQVFLPFRQDCAIMSPGPGLWQFNRLFVREVPLLALRFGASWSRPLHTVLRWL